MRWDDDRVTSGADDLVLGVGTAAWLDVDDELVLREFHPTGHAGFKLHVGVRDGVVTRAEAEVGFMHRGSEKLFESRDYRQLMMLANRHDWLSAFSSELVIALVLEEATGITPPERATWTRTLLAEANRVMATLAFLGAVAVRAEDRQAIFEARERLVHAQEVVTGGRVHPMFTRIGGVAAPITGEALEEYEGTIAELDALGSLIGDAVLSYADGLSGVSVLSPTDAIGFGASGAVARASGLDLDLRRDDPYLAYAELSDLLHVPTRDGGDARDRYAVLIEQVPVSVALMSACIERLRSLGPGLHDVPLPKTVRAPEGVTYGWIEGPLGITGCLLASVGDKLPWRMKIRSASFAHAQALQTALVGTPYDQLADAVMSFFFLVGDIDR
jgi:NADH-quinone oxidoreductase subunit D